MSNTRWWKESSSCKSGFLQDVSCLGSDICPWTGFFLSLFNHCHLGDRQQLPQRLRLWRAGARKGVTLSGILPVWCPLPLCRYHGGNSHPLFPRWQSSWLILKHALDSLLSTLLLLPPPNPLSLPFPITLSPLLPLSLLDLSHCW